MTANDYLQLGLYLVVLLALVKPLGAYMARVYEASRSRPSHRRSGRARCSIGCAASIADEEMTLEARTRSRCWCSTSSACSSSMLLQRLQAMLPLNPQGFGAVTPDSAFNTAVSFATNTNWQGYGGETTMSYLTQMLGLTVQNFVSAATGMAVLVALIRGFARAHGADDRQLLGRPDAHARSTSCCRCRSCWRWCWCRRAWCRPSRRIETCNARCSRRTGCRQGNARSPTQTHRRWARPRRRSPSSNSAPTAAASSTSTRRIRSRTRRRSPTFSSCWRSC